MLCVENRHFAYRGLTQGCQQWTVRKPRAIGVASFVEGWVIESCRVMSHESNETFIVYDWNRLVCNEVFVKANHLEESRRHVTWYHPDISWLHNFRIVSVLHKLKNCSHVQITQPSHRRMVLRPSSQFFQPCSPLKKIYQFLNIVIIGICNVTKCYSKMWQMLDIRTLENCRVYLRASKLKETCSWQVAPGWRSPMPRWTCAEDQNRPSVVVPPLQSSSASTSWVWKIHSLHFIAPLEVIWTTCS